MMSDTDARPALDLAAIEERHRDGGDGYCDYCATWNDDPAIRNWEASRWPCETERLRTELQAAREEIAYHHQESERWDVLADAARRFRDTEPGSEVWAVERDLFAAVDALDAGAGRERENG